MAGVVAVVAFTGCYHGSAHDTDANQLTRDRGWIMVDGLQLIRQKADRDCGAAALAMMLRRWSVPTSADEIMASLTPEEGHGIAAGALRDFARKKGVQAFLIQGRVTDLSNEVGMNRPVLVGLVQRYGDRALSHYEIVAGINEGARRLVLMDPGRGLREDSFDGFTSEWNAAGWVALVIVPS